MTPSNRNRSRLASAKAPLRVIESGLEPADWVVIQGIQQAIPGSKAAPEKIDMKTQPAEAGADAKATTTTQ